MILVSHWKFHFPIFWLALQFFFLYSQQCKPHQMIKIKQTYVFYMFFTNQQKVFVVFDGWNHYIIFYILEIFLNKAYVFFHHLQECKSILFILGDSSHLCAAQCSKNGKNSAIKNECANGCMFTLHLRFIQYFLNFFFFTPQTALRKLSITF